MSLLTTAKNIYFDLMESLDAFIPACKEHSSLLLTENMHTAVMGSVGEDVCSGNWPSSWQEQFNYLRTFYHFHLTHNSNSQPHHQESSVKPINQ